MKMIKKQGDERSCRRVHLRTFLGMGPKAKKNKRIKGLTQGLEIFSLS